MKDCCSTYKPQPFFACKEKSQRHLQWLRTLLQTTAWSFAFKFFFMLSAAIYCFPKPQRLQQACYWPTHIKQTAAGSVLSRAGYEASAAHPKRLPSQGLVALKAVTQNLTCCSQNTRSSNEQWSDCRSSFQPKSYHCYHLALWRGAAMIQTQSKAEEIEMDAANSRVGPSCCFKEGMFIASVDKPWKQQFQADAILRLCQTTG